MKHADRALVLLGVLALVGLVAWANNRPLERPAGFCGEGGAHCGCAAVATACNMPCQPGGCCPTMPCPVDGCAEDDR